MVQAFKDRLAVACGGFSARAKIQGSPTDKLEHTAGEEANVPTPTRTVEPSALEAAGRGLSGSARMGLKNSLTSRRQRVFKRAGEMISQVQL